MPALSSLTRQKLVTTQVEIEDEIVRFSFDANALTPAWASEIQRGFDQQGDAEAASRGLARLITSWDVTDDQGAAVQPSEEVLARFPLAVLAAFDRAIGEAVIPPSAEGNASSDTLSTPAPSSTVPQVSPQNGPATSQSPKPSESLSPT